MLGVVVGFGWAGPQLVAPTHRETSELPASAVLSLFDLSAFAVQGIVASFTRTIIRDLTHAISAS